MTLCASAYVRLRVLGIGMASVLEACPAQARRGIRAERISGGQVITVLYMLALHFVTLT